MARKRNDLLAQIHADVADGRVALSSLLQRCVALGRQPGSEKVRDWARWELNGYADAEVVPDYRHVHVALMAVITNNAGYNAITQQIHEDVFPAQIRDVLRETVGDIEELVVPFGVGMLEELASQGTDMHRFGPVWSSVMIDTLNKFNMAPNSRVAEVYWSVPNASIRSILVRVRATLADQIAELIPLTPVAQHVPDQHAAAQAIQFDEQAERQVVQFYLGNTINVHAGAAMTHNSGSQFNLSGITGNVAAGGSDFTQNYTAGFDIETVRVFADMVAGIADQIGLDARQQAEYVEATAELSEAVKGSADKGRMRKAVDGVIGYLKLATNKALADGAIALGTQAGNELDKAIHHFHP